MGAGDHVATPTVAVAGSDVVSVKRHGLSLSFVRFSCTILVLVVKPAALAEPHKIDRTNHASDALERPIGQSLQAHDAWMDGASG